MTAADQFATLGDFDLIALPTCPRSCRPYSRAKLGRHRMGKQRRRLCGPESRRADRRPQRGRLRPGSVWTWPSTPSPCAATASTTAPATPSAPTRTVWPNAPGSSPNTICSPNPHPPRRRLPRPEARPRGARPQHLRRTLRSRHPRRTCAGFRCAHTEFLVIAPRDVVQELTPAPTAMTPATSKPSSPSSRWSPAPAYSPTCWTSCAMRD